MDLDFNIDNYTLEEIENFFKLTTPYSLNDITRSEKIIVALIVKDGKLNGEKKNEFMDFVKEAKHRMIAKIKQELLEEELQNNGGYSKDYEFAIKRDIGKVVNQTTAPDTGGGNSFVMNRETTSFNELADPEKYLNPIESFPTDIARSNLNNLKRKTILQTVILNSLFREDYKNTSSTDFFLVLPYQFKNVLSIRLSSIQLPNVLYCFSSAKMNNMMFIEEMGLQQYGEVHGKGTVIIPDGNYTLCELASVLEKCINQQLSLDTHRFKVIGDEATQKITIVNECGPFMMSFLKDVGSPDFNSTLGWILGFREKEYNDSCNYTTEATYNSVASDYIFFILNDFNNSQTQNILAMYSKSYIGNNILAMIPLKAPSFHMCFDSGNNIIEKKREYFGPVNLQRLKIELRNQYGEILDLNQMDYSFSLEVQLGYDW